MWFMENSNTKFFLQKLREQSREGEYILSKKKMLFQNYIKNVIPNYKNDLYYMFKYSRKHAHKYNFGETLLKRSLSKES